MTSILVIEDDPAIRRGLDLNLRREGYAVLLAEDAETGRIMLAKYSPDLLVLDLMLPGMSGFELCRELRTTGHTLPILMLTARSAESDRVLGLDLGADDYVTKPFSVLELLARIRALLRRTEPAAEALTIVEFGRVRIDFVRHEATREGEPVVLPPKAFGVLRALIEREGQVVTREQLLDLVWGEDVMPTTRTVDNQMNLLRSRLEEVPATPRYLQTVYGIGYRFDGDARSDSDPDSPMT